MIWHYGVHETGLFPDRPCCICGEPVGVTGGWMDFGDGDGEVKYGVATIAPEHEMWWCEKCGDFYCVRYLVNELCADRERIMKDAEASARKNGITKAEGWIGMKRSRHLRRMAGEKLEPEVVS